MHGRGKKAKYEALIEARDRTSSPSRVYFLSSGAHLLPCFVDISVALSPLFPWHATSIIRLSSLTGITSKLTEHSRVLSLRQVGNRKSP
jgi:hypothetical protein